MASLLLPTVSMNTSGKAIDLVAYRNPLEGEQDTAINALWDQLVTLAGDAWTWRDEGCIASLQQCVDVLKKTVVAEWGKGDKAAAQGLVRIVIH